MKLYHASLVVAVCLFFASQLATAYATDQCSDILNRGIFNTTTVNQSVGIKNDYNAWLCTTEFSTHQEAYNAGISIGFPVYDIPLQLGATFDSNARETWKRSHCSSTTDRSQYSAAYQKIVSEISPNVVNAWRDCMIGLYQSRIGLSGVALARGATQVTMKIKWQPYDSFDARLPKVRGYSMVGATLQTVGSTLFRVGATVPATETNVDFVRQSPKQPVTLTINTDRGSVTAYVPPQTMSLKVSAQLNPTIERHEIQTKSYRFYEKTPDDDCVKDMNFEQTYYPPDGFTFTSYTSGETTKNGDRTNYSSTPSGNGVTFKMHVQGDDGLGGFCKRHGWLGLNINVTGERWVRVPMTGYSEEKSGSPLQESILIHYPYLQPSADFRNFQLQFVITVQKVIGDDVVSVHLTDGATTASGLTAKADSSGNLIVDGSQAFADWRRSLGTP
jgi:hypothetical protein